MTLARALGVPLASGVAVLAVGLQSCSDKNPPVFPPTNDHSAIVLRDRLGMPLTETSTEPYSPRQTCGACHDVDAIANGYHFQQGRTDADGNLQMQDDFFGDGRYWLKSDGMYGKW